MKKYGVTVPIAGAVWVEVEVGDDVDVDVRNPPEDLVYLALERAGELLQTWQTEDSVIGMLVELEAHESTGEGNVNHLTYNKIDVEEID